MNPYLRNPILTKFVLCEKFRCLPSQLDKEEARTMEEFIIIDNQIKILEEEKQREMESDMRLKGRNIG